MVNLRCKSVAERPNDGARRVRASEVSRDAIEGDEEYRRRRDERDVPSVTNLFTLEERH